ncbi:MAG: SGNH/GDSL hydrolase family protein [Paenibacillus dendritiformis]|uniref:SGNH/GDSL hydrolase family protein n=1 Tax=uncultured Paenibacillus sp. TaxID=227322 RepID=UPI0025E1210B|nr:SGNH/GDSL hydrolase family protein [uncultured Paenibacillus sp.]MDU5141679.1 SGNH/GDSL hydrolase family protein [Paenibacillus dendritiformis]
MRALKSNRCVPVLCTVHSIIEGSDASYYYRRHPQAWYESPSGAQAWLDGYNEAVRQAAMTTDTRLADIAERWDRELHSGTRLADLLRTKDNSGEDDGTHPTAWGHRIYADCIGGTARCHHRGIEEISMEMLHSHNSKTEGVRDNP